VLTKESGSIAWTAGNGVKVGQVVTLATDGAGVGEGVIDTITSATAIQLKNLNLPGAFTDVDYEIREKPISTIGDTNYAAGEIFGVDAAEQAAARGDNSQYRPAHAGWVGITSYTDMHGNQRVKTETLVANSSISADASDDTILPDS
jgi:hypothetical protein